MNTILNNGASVCTHDNFAVKARKNRLKRAMRKNIIKHQVKMNVIRGKRAQLARKLYTFSGVICGISYALVLLAMPLGV